MSRLLVVSSVLSYDLAYTPPMRGSVSNAIVWQEDRHSGIAAQSGASSGDAEGGPLGGREGGREGGHTRLWGSVGHSGPVARLVA